MDDDALDILACEIDLRPRGAPGIEEIACAAVGTERSGQRTLVVSFEPDAAPRVEAFAAAERRCCSTLSWAVAHSDRGTELTIGAAPQQIDVLQQVFSRGR
jgi:hypothetical protein